MELEDLTSQRFGKLTVIEPVESSTAKSQMWRCRCDCGKETIATTIQLTRGLTYHCGCKKIKDLTGQTFGRLFVIGLSDKRGKRGKRTTILWECRCECGEICYKPTDMLKNSDESMCAKCADKSHTTKARAKAGFVDGTQISKIRDMSRGQITENGIRDVCLNSTSNMWRAHIKFKSQNIDLGYYHRFEDAVKARRRAEEEYYGAFLENYDNAETEGV